MTYTELNINNESMKSEFSITITRLIKPPTNNY